MVINKLNATTLGQDFHHKIKYNFLFMWSRFCRRLDTKKSGAAVLYNNEELMFNTDLRLFQTNKSSYNRKKRYFVKNPYHFKLNKW